VRDEELRIMKETLSIRIDPDNPNHHLWKNGERWWIHYTVLTDGGRQHRVRYSLRTPDVEVARVLRDAVFAAWTDEPDDAARLLSRDARIELAASADGLRIPCQAPNTAHVPRLARIDRGYNMLGSLIDEFYLARDEGCDVATALVLWGSLDGTQLDDGVGRIVPLARVPLEDFLDPEQGRADLRAAGACMLHAWTRYNVECSWLTEDGICSVEGGDLLDDAAVEHIVERAFAGRPLDARRIFPRDERGAS
jgi:hypothetical protein